MKQTQGFLSAHICGYLGKPQVIIKLNPKQNQTKQQQQKQEKIVLDFGSTQQPWV